MIHFTAEQEKRTLQRIESESIAYNLIEVESNL